jgi:hypothetical protein
MSFSYPTFSITGGEDETVMPGLKYRTTNQGRIQSPPGFSPINKTPLADKLPGVFIIRRSNLFPNHRQETHYLHFESADVILTKAIAIPIHRAVEGTLVEHDHAVWISSIDGRAAGQQGKGH